MGLRKAIEGLPGDRVTECTIREILQLFRIRSGEWMSTADVARRLDRPEDVVSAILVKLAGSFVLSARDERFALVHDSFNDREIDRFLKRVENHTGLVRANVEKFRDRFGQR